jgi:hypothetical protein
MNYYRCNNNEENPMSDYGHAMFVFGDADNVAHYGNIIWTVDGNKYPGEATLRELIFNALENDDLPTSLEDMIEDFGKDEIVDSFFPEDIVNSAEAYDNADLVWWFYETVIEPNGFDGVKTDDGAVSFNPNDITRA